MNNAFLIGETVYLRPLETSDAEQIAPWLNDPEVNRTLHLCRPISVQSEIDFINAVNKSDTEITLAIARREDDRLLGCTGLDHVDLRHRNARFGIFIGDKQHWGKGYATEATKLIVEHAFSRMNLHKVWLHVIAHHEPAIHVYERIGFQREGVLRQHLFVEGQYHDLLTMAILSNEVPR